MKKLIVIIAACIFTSGVFAQDYKAENKMQNDKQSNSSYCALLKDGKMTLMKEGKQVNNEVTLSNGFKIRTDATLVKTDRTETVLKNGECVDKDGNIITSQKEQ